MSVGFIVRCSKCTKPIVETKGFEQDTFDKLNVELGKVTEGFIGTEEGQAQIEGYEEMYKLAAFPMYCSKGCSEDNWLSDLKKFWNENIRFKSR